MKITSKFIIFFMFGWYWPELSVPLNNKNEKTWVSKKKWPIPLYDSVTLGQVINFKSMSGKLLFCSNSNWQVLKMSNVEDKWSDSLCNHSNKMQREFFDSFFLKLKTANKMDLLFSLMMMNEISFTYAKICVFFVLVSVSRTASSKIWFIIYCAKYFFFRNMLVLLLSYWPKMTATNDLQKVPYFSRHTFLYT